MPARQGLELFGEQLSRLLQSVFVHVYLSLLSLCHLSWFLLSLRFGLHLSAPTSVISPGRSDLVLERRQSYQVFGVYMCVCVVGVGGGAGLLVTASKPGISLLVQEGQRDTDTKEVMTGRNGQRPPTLWRPLGGSYDCRGIWTGLTQASSGAVISGRLLARKVPSPPFLFLTAAPLIPFPPWPQL